MQCELNERLCSLRNIECIEDGELLQLILNERITYAGEEEGTLRANILTLDVYYDYVYNDYYNVDGVKALHGNIKKYYDEEADQTYLFAFDFRDKKSTITGARVSGVW